MASAWSGCICLRCAEKYPEAATERADVIRKNTEKKEHQA